MSPALQVGSLSAVPPGKPKNTTVGSLSFLQGIFPPRSQIHSAGLLHCRWILYQLSYQGSCMLLNYISEGKLENLVALCNTKSGLLISWEKSNLKFHPKSCLISELLSFISEQNSVPKSKNKTTFSTLVESFVKCFHWKLIPPFPLCQLSISIMILYCNFLQNLVVLPVFTGVCIPCGCLHPCGWFFWSCLESPMHLWISSADLGRALLCVEVAWL